MNTLCDARIVHFWKVLKRSVIILAVIALIIFLNSSKFGAIVEVLTPPTMPDVTPSNERVWLDQNWSPETRARYHHISQGTRTLPIPYQWFVSLERPSSSLIGMLFADDVKLSDNEYLLRFGFIADEKSASNPDGLPIGFARTPTQPLPGLSERADAIGFTCAACHTGQFVHDGKQYVIDGGPATTDLGQLTEALGAALAQTALSSKLAVFDYRFDRFARNVLGERYSDTTKEELSGQLASVLEVLAAGGDIIDVTEGFTRVDALNRIGNQVFAEDYPHRDNYAPINAPVNFPHIWTSSWFSWVQYDGSIMAPLVRNAGEALGVAAYLDTKSPLDEKRFGSSIPIRNLDWIENALKGEGFGPDVKYTGLTAPRWPESLKRLDPARVKQGADIYRTHCQGCHLPPLDSKELWQDVYYGPIEWTDAEGRQRETSDSVLKVKLIPHRQIGTDMAQANILVNRMVDISGRADLPAGEQTPGLGLNINLCGHPPEDPGAKPNWDLVTVPFSDGGNVPFALALGAIVQQTIDAWLDQNYILSEEQRLKFESDRPNCLQAGAGYRARPLNGVWATAPFLHNGSVPTLMDLLLPVKERPTLVQLGGTRFDVDKVGIKQDPELRMEQGSTYADNGLFILDTSLPGNLNTGHEFSDAWIEGNHYSNQPRGVIGPALSEQERLAIIEYLKTL